jgi:hypothetical protein
MYETTPSLRRWPRTTIEKRPRLGRSAGSKSTTHLSFNKLSGHFDPGGNKNFSGEAFSVGCACLFFDEFPAFPDFTIPFRGGID